jgi:hypothetical protein
MTDAEIEARYPGIVAKHLIARRRRVLASLPQLRGWNLACRCSPIRPCHADLLLKLANEQEARPEREVPAVALPSL